MGRIGKRLAIEVNISLQGQALKDDLDPPRVRPRRRYAKLVAITT